jgi:membrane fusion protein (multidrug efflux system)
MNVKRNKKHRWENILLSLVAILVLITAAVYLTVYLINGQRYEETNDAQVEGYINPISARVSGFIKSVKFNEEQAVRTGDTLVIIDDQEYRQKQKNAAGGLETAEADLKVLMAHITSAEADMHVDRDQIDAENARYVEQQRDIKRIKNLVKEEAATGSDLDAVQSRFDVSRSNYEAAKDKLVADNSKINELKVQVSLLEAAIKQKQSDVELARINIAYTVIKAPYAGRLGRKTILEGQQVQTGEPLVSIVDESRKWITANFKETQVNGMYVGQPVDIKIDAISGKVFKGKVDAIAASTGAKFSLLPPDNSTGNFVKIVQRIPVRISFTDNDLQKVRLGMNALVSIKK